MNEREIKKDLLSSLDGLIQRYLDISSLSKPTSSGNFFAAKVVDNNDSEKLGRVRVMVYGKFEGIPDQDLPWAVPDFNILGEFKVPEVNSLVTVYFRDNDLYCPHYTTKVVKSDELSEERLEDYPNTVVFFETSDGEFFKINKKTQETVYRHSSGALLTINKNGQVTLNTQQTTTGTLSLNIRGNVTVECNGAASVTSLTSISVNAPLINSPSGVVAPTGSGFMCAMPIDPLTGAPQVGNTFVRT